MAQATLQKALADEPDNTSAPREQHQFPLVLKTYCCFLSAAALVAIINARPVGAVR
ncbi:hypothetical protein MXD81_48915 [Microbacteriaceae bacterium K1510]|nr:hypothetical protein [Microbacteriaceae bacterium K1510]